MMKHKVGDKITYDTPLSGGGIYEAEVLELEAANIYKVRVLRIVRASKNPIAPQKIGDIDHIIRESNEIESDKEQPKTINRDDLPHYGLPPDASQRRM